MENLNDTSTGHTRCGPTSRLNKSPEGPGPQKRILVTVRAFAMILLTALLGLNGCLFYLLVLKEDGSGGTKRNF